MKWPSITGWGAFWAVALVNAAWWLALQFMPAHDTGANFWFNAAYAVPFFASGAVMLAVAWRWRDGRYPETAPITLLAASMALYGCAQIAWTYYNVAEGVEVPEFSLADVFYIVSVLLRLLAVVALFVHRMRKRPLSRPVVALLALGSVAASFASVWFLFAQLRGEGLLNLETFYTTVSFLTMFTAIMALNRDRHGELRAFLYLFFFSAAAHGMADFVYAVRDRAETYWNGDMADGLYALGAILMHAGALMLPRAVEHAKETESRDRSSAFVIPLAITLVGLVAALRMGDYLYVSGTAQLEDETEAVASRAAAMLHTEVGMTLTGVRAVSGLFLGSREVTQEEFDAFARSLTGYAPGSIQLSFVDPSGRIAFSIDRSAVGYDIARDPVRAALLEEAREGRSVVVSEPMRLLNGQPGAVVLVPIFRDESYLGTAAGSVILPKALSSVGELAVMDGFEIRLQTPEHEVSADGTVIYGLEGRVAYADPSASGAESVAPLGDGVRREEVSFDGTAWGIAVTPTISRAYASYQTALVGFFATFTFVFMVAAVVYLLMTQRQRLREQLSLKTRSLEESVADLTRKRHYLDAVNDAVVVKQGGKVAYANSAAAAFLGVPEGKMGARTSWPYGAVKADPAAVREALARDGKWDGEARVAAEGKERDLAVSVRAFRPGTREEAEILIASDVSARKAVERAKTQFVSMVAHQLRAPMTQMRWIVEQLQSTPKLPASAKSALADLDEISTTGGKFIGDILNVSRIERGVLKLETGTIALSALVKQVLEPLVQTAKERGTSFQVGDIPKSAAVSVDVDKAVEALRNVADNATKYAPKGTKVEIAVQDDGKKGWVVSVADKGPGIPKEFWDKVFEIKTEVTPGASSGSAGLGLYLTKKFLDAMGGGVSFKTSPKGTTFLVRFPAA